MISQTETAGGGNQYGFYAVPKALEPKKKYRDNEDEEYEDEANEDQQNAFATIEDRQPANEKELERDYYVDQAPYPQFKPKERGLDFGVQIERGDLFDFDLQVRPLIQILVGRSVVSAINQLQEQKEKEERKNNLDKYQKKRNAELMVTQRLQAKHKRKIEEADRRRLQKDIYVKNQKEAGKKIIARKNAKQSLLGLRDQLFNQLQDLGFLSSHPTNDLKIKYEEWLYAQILQALKFQADSQTAAIKLLEEQQKKLAEEHKKFINEQMTRRQGILDQRERLRKENEERKEKKRIKKMRRRLNAQREPDFIKFEELMERYEQVNNILKFPQRSNGFSNESASRSALYIAGGLENFVLALLQSSQKDFSAEQVQAILIKIITQSGKQLDFPLSVEHFDRIQEVKKRMQEQNIEFMRDKQNEVKALSQQITIDLSLLEANNINIKTRLLNSYIQAFLSIYLTVRPQSTQENVYELPEKQKKRLDLVEKIHLIRQQESFAQRLQKVDRVLRVHFQILRSEEQSNKSKSQPVQEEVVSQEWIDIYDGQGWVRRKKEQLRQLNRAEQQAAAITLTGFQNSFVVDQRTTYYLQRELQKLLEVSGGEKMHKYCQNLNNIQARIKKSPPVFDGQVRLN